MKSSLLSTFVDRTDVSYYGISYSFYDTDGLIGNPQTDIWKSDELLREINDTFHAVIFCITAVRLHQSGDNILRLISSVGGAAIKSLEVRGDQWSLRGMISFPKPRRSWKKYSAFLSRMKVILEKTLFQYEI